MVGSMRLTIRVSLLFAAPLLWAQPPQPEVFSPLGRSFLARPDEKLTVQAADLALTRAPDSADLLLAAARARDVILRFSESIPLYTRGIDAFPADVRFPRFRGHRFISIRRFDPAIVDLKLAATLAPASFDVSYHLALAHYLRGDFSHAAREYQRCLSMASEPRPAYLKGMPLDWRSCFGLDDDSRVAVTEWAWRALRRSSNPAAAAKLLATIHPKLNVTDNKSYFRTLLLYQGVHSEADILAPPLDGNAEPTMLYGVGLWHWLDGRKERACAAWTRAVSGPNWAAFGFIAAEAELARGLCKSTKSR